jgi:hypothetical protein
MRIAERLEVQLPPKHGHRATDLQRKYFKYRFCWMKRSWSSGTAIR